MAGAQLLSYDIEFYLVEKFQLQSTESGQKATLQLGNKLQDGAVISPNDMICAKITITGQSGQTNNGSEVLWYKVEGMADAWAKYPDSPTGQKELGPDAYLLDSGFNVLTSFQHSNTSTPDLTWSSYFPPQVTTDTYYFVVGPFNNFEGFQPSDILSASMTVLLYDKIEQSPGPTPTSEGGEKA